MGNLSQPDWEGSVAHTQQRVTMHKKSKDFHGGVWEWPSGISGQCMVTRDINPFIPLTPFKSMCPLGTPVWSLSLAPVPGSLTQQGSCPVPPSGRQGLRSGSFSAGLRRLFGGGDVRMGTWRKQGQDVEIRMDHEEQEALYVAGGMNMGRVGRHSWFWSVDIK